MTLDPTTDSKREELVSDRDSGLENSIELSEHRKLNHLLSTPPQRKGSGLSEREFESLITEVRIHHLLALKKPSSPTGQFLNERIQEAIDRDETHFNPLEKWRLNPITDEKRLERDGPHIVGQVPDQKRSSNEAERTCIAAHWQVTNQANENRMLLVSVKPKVEWVQVSPTETGAELAGIPIEDLRRLLPQPWRAQAKRNSDAGEWLVALTGTATSGYLKGLPALGSWSEEIQIQCDALELTNYFLPRARRDACDQPWHTGQFLEETETGFFWPGAALDPEGQPVKVEIQIGAEVKIETVREV